jgi:amidohydrolase
MVATESRLRGDIDEIMPGVIADRRHLHMHPEMGFQEHETATFIAERLRSLGVEEIRTGVGKTGITGLIRGTGGNGSKVILLRADMDALPITEENEVEYRSQNAGVMHACGHDTHVSMLLGTARMLTGRRDQFSGTVKLLFQPAEEGGGGAKAMISAGALEDPKPEAAFGIHIWQEFPVGTVMARAGTAMVGADSFTITVCGKGGHGGLPHLTIDPVAIGAQIIVALQTIVSRENDPNLPAIVTTATLQAGTAPNVIPDTATMTGTIRTVNEEQRAYVPRRIEEIAKGIAEAMRAEADVTIRWGVPPLVNDPVATEAVRAAAVEVVGEENVTDGPLLTVSEDMAEILRRAPGCFFFVGSRNPEKGLVWGHHHARFDVDEDALAVGIETMTRTVLRVLRTED